MRYILLMVLLFTLNLASPQAYGSGTHSFELMVNAQQDTAAEKWLIRSKDLYPEKLDSSLIFANRALGLLQQDNLKGSSLEATILNTLGDINNQLGQLEEAESLYHESLEINLSKNNLAGISEAYFDLGNLEQQRGNFEEAFSFYSQSLDTKKEIDDKRGQASVLNNLGNLYRAWGKMDSALISYNRSIELSKNVGDEQLLANAYLNLGNWMARETRFKEARSYYEEYKKIQEARKDTLALIKATTNLGNLDLDQGRYSLALERYLEGLRILEKKGAMNSSYANVLSNIGAVFERQGDNIRAKEYFRKAITIYDSLGYNSDKANVLTFIGMIHLMEGKKDSALVLYDQASTLYGDDNKRSLALLYQKIGRVHYVDRNYQQALDQYQRAEEMFKSIEDDRSLSHLYNSIGASLYFLEDYDTALGYYREALSKSIQTNYLQQKQNALFNIYEILELKGQYAEALDYYKQYAAVRNQRFDQQKNRDILEITTKYETEKKDAEISLLQAEQDRNQALIQKQAADRRSLFIGVIALLAVIVGIAWWFIYKIRKEKVIAGQKEQIYRQEIDSLMEKQQLESVQSMLEGQDKERKRLAAELHDRLGSLLSLVKLYFSSMESSIKKAKPELQNTFEDGKKFLDETFTEVRAIIKEMNDSKVSGKGLRKDIDELLMKVGKFDIDIESNIKLENDLPEATELHIYRIIQEALSNALKYSKATLIKLSLISSDEKIELLVQDNGVGYTPETSSPQQTSDGGYGLGNMENRAKLLGGTFTIQSSEGKGMGIHITIPVQEQNESKTLTSEVIND